MKHVYILSHSSDYEKRERNRKDLEDIQTYYKMKKSQESKNPAEAIGKTIRKITNNKTMNEKAFDVQQSKAAAIIADAHNARQRDDEKARKKAKSYKNIQNRQNNKEREWENHKWVDRKRGPDGKWIYDYGDGFPDEKNGKKTYKDPKTGMTIKVKTTPITPKEHDKNIKGNKPNMIDDIKKNAKRFAAKIKLPWG